VRAQALPKIGGPAPDLAFRTILGAADEMHGTWQELKGKAVVIEFWATWCGFCVDSIPHLNELAKKFSSRPVQFVSVTDETDVRLVTKFLTEHPIAGWVAFDDNEATFNRFGVGGRPITVLVDTDGIVRGILNPGQVTAETLDDLLAGKTLKFAPPPASPVLGLEQHAPPPLFQVLIRPAAPVAVSEVSPGWENNKEGRLTAYGHTMLQILSKVYRVPPSRVEAPQWCSTSLYDISVVLPQGKDGPPWPLIKQGLETAFDLKVHMELRQTTQGKFGYLVVDSITQPTTR
jgi:thiol-disulfide isomerase/thioredoxin